MFIKTIALASALSVSAAMAFANDVPLNSTVSTQNQEGVIILADGTVLTAAQVAGIVGGTIVVLGVAAGGGGGGGGNGTTTTTTGADE